MKWTEAQQQTIDIRDRNILVSAAAGSGKTAVLVERIKQLIIRDKTDIDRFLITTFTKAASSEMKERLEKAIKEEMERPDSDRVFLRRQLDLLPDANISTFHTFSLEVMRRYFYLTDLEPGFKVGDDVRIAIMKNEAVDQMFENRFENDSERFTCFLRKYSSDRSEQKIKRNIINIYDEMRSIPNYMEWADEKCSLMSGAEAQPIHALGIETMLNEKTEDHLREASECYCAAAEVLEKEGLENLYEKALQDAERVDEQYEKFADDKDRSELADFLNEFKPNQMRATKDEKDWYAAVKDIVTAYRKQGKKCLDELKNKFCALSDEEYNYEIISLYDDTEYFIELIREFEEEFRARKKEKNIIDFDDAMHYAIEILANDTAAAEYREKFRYIFIDEFQDSNELQEKIINCIRRENNLFMVGDIKQSIYKFRLAEPEIFRRKYREYKADDGRTSIKIDLNSNFRSKSSVTETVNAVFDGLMDDYDEDARLHCTAREDTPGYRTQLHIIDRADTDGEDDFFENNAAEAALAAELIRENLGCEIYDAALGCSRPVQYRDIAVLSRSGAMVPDIEKYLNNEGIPAYGEGSGGYFDTVEIQVFINLLRTVNNTRQDIPLISVMKSAVFGFSARELAQIRIASNSGSYFSAVMSYAESGEDESLADKITAMLAKLDYWKELSRAVPLEELVRILMYNTGYYDYCSSLPLGKQRAANLRILIDRAAAFEKSDYTGLYGFLKYVDAMKRSRKTVEEARVINENENLVRVMTVHKSKGLEFPIVILAGAGKEIKYGGSGSPASMHKDLGIGLPVVDKDECWHRKSILQKMIDARKADENVEEEIRILYVAMTRAKDKLIIAGTVKDRQKFDEKIKDKGSFLEMIYDAAIEHGDEIIMYNADIAGDAGRFTDMRQYRQYAELEAESMIFDDTDEKLRQIDRILSYRYPYADNENIKSKYSVTELSSRESSGKLPALVKPAFALDRKKLSASEIGTAVHKVMEKLDFAAVPEGGYEYIRLIAERLARDGRIPEESLRYIKIDNLIAFFRSEIGRRAVQAARMGQLEKEREFILSRNISGADTIIQGIVDCYFREADGIVLVDYKNVWIDKDMSIRDIAEKYSTQIDVYREALEAAERQRVKEAYLYLFAQRKFIKIP